MNESKQPEFEMPTSLVDFVSNMLSVAGHPNPTGWTAYVHADAMVTNDLNIQRFLINRAWRSIIGRLEQHDVDTMDVRFCLVDTGEIKDWCRLFQESVLPCILEFQLPLPAPARVA